MYTFQAYVEACWEQCGEASYRMMISQHDC